MPTPQNGQIRKLPTNCLSVFDSIDKIFIVGEKLDTSL